MKVITSTKGVSFENIAVDVVKVAKGLGVDASFIDRLITPYEAVKRGYRIITIMCADPLSAGSWLLFARDLNKAKVPNVFYTTVEGKIGRRHLAPWMREVRFVANSEYTASKLREAGFDVIDVIHHGIDLELMDNVSRDKSAGIEYMRSYGLDPKRHFVVLTVCQSHPRKGLALYDKAIGYVEKRDPSIKFFVITGAEGRRYFRPWQNLVMSKDFGRLPRETVLATMACAHILAMPSLAEGFGMPALEAMALGTPAVHADLPPLMEFSTGFAVRSKEVVDFDNPLATGSGFVFEHHLYEPEEFAEVLLQVADMVRNKKDELEEWRARSRKVAEEHDIHVLYPDLVKHVL